MMLPIIRREALLPVALIAATLLAAGCGGGKSVLTAMAAAIGKALAVNAVLNTLNLSYNGIGLEGAKAIGEALAVNGVLKSINLRGNSLGTEGWCAIFAALRDNKENKIESWDLSKQGIDSEVAKVLAEYVSTSTAPSMAWRHGPCS